jgi:oligopeptide transport system substrate-binding protein
VKRCLQALLVTVLILSSISGCTRATKFEVSSLIVTPSEVAVGEAVTVKAEVKNTGDVEGTYIATLKVDGNVAETKEVIVGAGATEEVSFTYLVESAGTYTIDLDGLTSTVMAVKTAKIEVTSLDVSPTLVLPGQQAKVEADVANVSEAKGTVTATLAVNGVETDTRPVTLDAGASDRVSFTVIRDIPSTYDIEVGGLSATLTVPEVETYDSERFLYSISYPSGWALDDSTPDRVTMSKIDVADLGVRVNILPAGVSLDNYLDTVKEEFWQLQEVSRDEIKEDGAVIAYDVICTYTKQGETQKMRMVVSKRGRYGFSRWAEANETIYEDNRPLLDACLESFEPPTIAVGPYANTTHGFSIMLPSGWDGMETGERMPILIATSPVGEPLIYFYTFVDRIYESTTAKDFALYVVSDFSEAKDYRTISEGEVTLGEGTEGYEVVFSHKEGAFNIKRNITSVIRGTQAFVMMIYTLSSTYDKEQGTINEIVSSFALTERRPFGVSRQSSLFLWEGEIVTLDPALTEGEQIIDAVFSGLVKMGKDWEVVPDIAESWDVSEDGTVYTFHLREDVRFHDGKPVTARDFKYSWERACDPETESRKASTYLGDIVGAKQMLAGEATELSGVRVIDDRTLEVIIDGPKPYFLGKLTWPTGFVVDRANVARGMNWTNEPNGTGPFKLKEWKKDELVVLERNDGYYSEPAKLENIVFQIFAGRQMMMYEQGEIDIAGVYLDDLDRVLDPKNPLNKELMTEPGVGIDYLAFNVTMPPFDDPKVRRAFALALDMDKIIEVSFKDNTKRSGSYIPPQIPGHNEELEPLPFDPEQAKQFIAESKYGSIDNLPPIVFYDLYYLSPGDEAKVAMWQQNLGVTVEVEIIEELEEWHERIHNREFQLSTGSWYADYIDPQNFLEVLFHSQSEENRSAYSNPEIDTALEKAAVEQDEEVRLKMYQDIEKFILEALPIVPRNHSWIGHVLVKPYVKGWSMTPTDVNYWTLISIEPH